VFLRIEAETQGKDMQARITFSGTRDEIEALLAQAAKQLALLPPEPPPAADPEPGAAEAKQAGR
jgi:hypothetical protein